MVWVFNGGDAGFQRNSEELQRNDVIEGGLDRKRRGWLGPEMHEGGAEPIKQHEGRS